MQMIHIIVLKEILFCENLFCGDPSSECTAINGKLVLKSIKTSMQLEFFALVDANAKRQHTCILTIPTVISQNGSKYFWSANSFFFRARHIFCSNNGHFKIAD